MFDAEELNKMLTASSALSQRLTVKSESGLVRSFTLWLLEKYFVRVVPIGYPVPIEPSMSSSRAQVAPSSTCQQRQQALLVRTTLYRLKW
jgi:hypothetical protein